MSSSDNNANGVGGRFSNSRLSQMHVHEDWLAKKKAEIEAKLMQKEKASREQRLKAVVDTHKNLPPKKGLLGKNSKNRW